MHFIALRARTRILYARLGVLTLLAYYNIYCGRQVHRRYNNNNNMYYIVYAHQLSRALSLNRVFPKKRSDNSYTNSYNII